MNQENLQAVLRCFPPGEKIYSIAPHLDHILLSTKEINEIVEYFLAYDIIENFYGGDLDPAYYWKLKISDEKYQKLLLL